MEMVLFHWIFRRRGQNCSKRIWGRSSNTRRWFCRTAAISNLHLLFPAHAINNPRSFVQLAPAIKSHREPFWLSTRRGFGKHHHKNDGDSSSKTVVLSSLQSLVSRLEEWEPNLALPSSTTTTSSQEMDSGTTAVTPTTTSTIPIATDTSNAYESFLSIEEYAKIFCKGYLDLPPLQLGWIATTTAFTEGLLPLHDWECRRSAVLFFLARDCLFSVHLPSFLEDLQTTTSTSLNGNNIAPLQERIRKAWTPKFEQIFQLLLEQNSGHTVPLLVQLRADILRLMTVLPKDDENESTKLKQNLQQLEGHVRRLLSTWFSPGMLDIRRITYDTTSAGIIEKVALKEAVHPMKSLDDLRRRLGPKRRVFALFHPLLPNEPLVILHVHLETKPNHIPSAMTQVLTEEDPLTATTTTTTTAETLLLQPLVATFYSISNAQPGLARGLGLGEFLIKQTVQQLQQEFPSSLQTFVTLSPMPGFRKWLESVLVREKSSHDDDDDDDDQEWAKSLAARRIIGPNFIRTLALDRPLLQQLLKCGSGNDEKNNNSLEGDTTIEQQLEEVQASLTMLAAYYLVLAKNPRTGKPLDPVTGFHVHNGAEVYRINCQADLSRKGMLRSLGIMVNYRYQLDQIKSNKAMLESSHYGRIPVSEEVQGLLPQT